MYYTIYKITNNIDGKYYIGKHKTSNLNDGYMGSGKLLKRAIKKHGIENFTKDILFIFQTEQDMNEKEKELVVISEETYNLCSGGHGGFDYVNRTRDHLEHNRKISAKRDYSDPAFRQKISDKIAGKPRPTRKGVIWCDWTGRKHSEETKQKMSLANKGKIPWNKGLSKQ